MVKKIDLIVAVNEGSVGIDITANSLWLKDLERARIDGFLDRMRCDSW